MGGPGLRAGRLYLGMFVGRDEPQVVAGAGASLEARVCAGVSGLSWTGRGGGRTGWGSPLSLPTALGPCLLSPLGYSRLWALLPEPLTWWLCPWGGGSLVGGKSEHTPLVHHGNPSFLDKWDGWSPSLGTPMARGLPAELPPSTAQRRAGRFGGPPRAKQHPGVTSRGQVTLPCPHTHTGRGLRLRTPEKGWAGGQAAGRPEPSKGMGWWFHRWRGGHPSPGGWQEVKSCPSIVLGV